MVRITAKDRDTLAMDYVFKNLHSDPDGKTKFSASGACTTIFHDGWWYASTWAKTPAERRNAGVRMALTDGKLETFPLTKGGGYTSPIMVGRKIVFFGDLRAYGSAMDIRGTLEGVGEANVCDLDAGRVVGIKSALIDRRLGEDSDYARRNRRVGTASLGGHASPSAQANRIFQRTKGVLYCIGDPKQPFPVPGNCPPQGRIGK